MEIIMVPIAQLMKEMKRDKANIYRALNMMFST